MRLNQPHDRMPPLRVPILTKMVVSASVASVLYALLLETTSEQQRAAAVHHSHVHRVHHVRGGADDVSGLLIAALTASTHTPIGRGSEDLGCKHLPFDGSQRSCCWLADAAAMPTAVGLTLMQLPPVAT